MSGDNPATRDDLAAALRASADEQRALAEVRNDIAGMNKAIGELTKTLELVRENLDERHGNVLAEQRELDQRVTKLERFRWAVAGALAIAGGGIGATASLVSVAVG